MTNVSVFLKGNILVVVLNFLMVDYIKITTHHYKVTIQLIKIVVCTFLKDF